MRKLVPIRPLKAHDANVFHKYPAITKVAELVGKNAHVADVADHSVKYRQLIVFKIRIKIKKITS